ncbi:MAG TPA: MBL fold metallo-hydrolase [Thermoflexia bacterium]|jgi:glyoxylase-like metal-dependent hydrolase (beta-lactamase superfamily II)|nr:MBL fold metallo-hydrolase [Thermoflexia bacterium]
MSDVPPYLHRLSVPTPFPVGPVNVYLVEDGDGLTLIDVGPRFTPARKALHEGLATFGHRLRDVRRIILTHTHSDHAGMAAEVVEASGAQVLTHPWNFPELADYSAERERRLAFYAALMQEAGMNPEVMAQIAAARRGFSRFAQAVQPDLPLEEGTVLYLGGEPWQVLHTPGHTGGLICLYQPERRLLLSSDHLLRDVSSNPIVEPPRREGEPRPKRLLDYLAQLKRVAQMGVDLALPSHGPPITDVKGLIERRLAFHRERAQQVLDVLSGGERSAYEISLALFPDLDPINRFLAVSEVIGHLDWLEEQGKVTSRMDGPIRRWIRRV